MEIPWSIRIKNEELVCAGSALVCTYKMVSRGLFITTLLLSVRFRNDPLGVDRHAESHQVHPRPGYGVNLTVWEAAGVQ